MTFERFVALVQHLTKCNGNAPAELQKCVDSGEVSSDELPVIQCCLKLEKLSSRLDDLSDKISLVHHV